MQLAYKCDGRCVTSALCVLFILVFKLIKHKLTELNSQLVSEHSFEKVAPSGSTFFRHCKQLRPSAATLLSHIELNTIDVAFIYP